MDADQALREYLPMVQGLARQMSARLPASVDRDDLIQEGLLGVLQALDSYDATAGAALAGHAWRRAKGQMLDHLRRGDWLSRHDRCAVRTLQTCSDTLQQQMHRRPKLSELASALGQPLAEVSRLQALAAFQPSQDAAALLQHPDPAPGPEDVADHRSRQALLQRGLATLPPAQALALQGLIDGRGLHQIAQATGVTDSRVSQLQADAGHALQQRVQALQAPAGSVAPTLGSSRQPNPVPRPRRPHKHTHRAVQEAQRLLAAPGLSARTRATLGALAQHGSPKRAAHALGCSAAAVRVALTRARARAAKNLSAGD